MNSEAENWMRAEMRRLTEEKLAVLAAAVNRRDILERNDHEQ